MLREKLAQYVLGCTRFQPTTAGHQADSAGWTLVLTLAKLVTWPEHGDGSPVGK
jgi:hypothetical protein